MTVSEGLEISGLSVTYPGRPARVAVEAATLSLRPRESLALVGPSGSGKSSLLLAIAGVVPSPGTLRWDGRDLHGVPTNRRGIGLVFQDGQLFPHLTVAQNVGFGLEMQGVGRAERVARVGTLLDMVGLPDAADRPVTELSGGERQRVALIRTLAPRPQLVLLDEPLSSLDADLRGRLAVDVRAVLEDVGTTWIVVTHDVMEAQVMAGRIVRMVNGRTV